ncbi:MAG: helix-turn-helix domain-containing protein [Pseudomonadota bacterium]
MNHWHKHWSQRPLSADDRQNGPVAPRNASAIDPDKLYTTPEAAEILRWSPRTAERQRVQGDGPPFVKLGNGSRARVVYRGADLIAWIESQVRNSTSDRGR